ncbi:helix-turn-helix domain-containing protein [Brevundimonas sp.]|uniref:helix-turn-helix domain-containing protein n=1 Tax=Brevundimonas sp. TaxID=1871086 RepID=UPI00289FF7D7|nr:helix-turn-helix domain-containing protein [Brevundimonas sp.]
MKDREAADRRRKGLALKALRRRLGVTQEAAANALGVTVQAWQNYEAGKRHLSDPKLAAILVEALNSDREEFDAELTQIPDDLTPSQRERLGAREAINRGSSSQPPAAFHLPVGGIAHGGALRPNVYDDGGEAEVIDFSRYFAPGTRVLRLGGMSMFPYAEPGGFVTYNPRQPARRGQGCVIEMKDGSYAVKRFERFDADHLVVTELFPEERELQLPLADVAGVYAIGLRGE